MRKLIFNLIRKTCYITDFACDMLKLFFGSSYLIKYVIFIIVVSISIVIFNSFIFCYLDINNNIHFFIMVMVSRFIKFILVFIYDETELFKSIFINRKVVYEKIKNKIKENTSLENIIIIILHYFVCLKLKNIIIPYIPLDINKNTLGLCILTLIMLVISVINKLLITFLIKYIKSKFNC